jgi:hypothetical protein
MLICCDQSGTVNIREDNTAKAVVESMTEEERREVQAMAQDEHIYQNLVNSIAPAVYGHDDVKRGILLMLFGGVHKSTIAGVGIRGDINVCIVGDPSTAKSQFLKCVSANAKAHRMDVCLTHTQICGGLCPASRVHVGEGQFGSGIDSVSRERRRHQRVLH